MFITAAVLAEICSALPLSGSIYIWSAESAGPKYARFFGFIVAWWSCTAWMTFAAGNCQVRSVTQPSAAPYLLDAMPDYRQLHRLAARRMGSGLPWWRRQRQYQVASAHLGCLRGHPSRFHRNQLPPASVVFSCFPFLHCTICRRFPSLRRMAAYRGIKDLWLPVCEGGVYNDL